MTCSCSGLSSIILVFVAMLLSVAGFFLPLWVMGSDFKAGVWAYHTSRVGGQIYFGTENVQSPSTEIEAYAKLSSITSVCGRYKIASSFQSSWAETIYAHFEGIAAGVESTKMYEFVANTCGGMGQATLAFSVLGWVAGLFAFFSLLCGVSCCAKKSCLVIGGTGIAAFACLSSFLAFILWAAQSKPLRDVDTITYGVSFYLYIAAFVLYGVGAGLRVLQAKANAKPGASSAA